MKTPWIHRKRWGRGTPAGIPEQTLTVRIHIQMSARMYACLNRIANETGLSIAELIRRAIDLVYRPYRVPKIRGLVITAVRYQPTTIVSRRPGKKLVD